MQKLRNEWDTTIQQARMEEVQLPQLATGKHGLEGDDEGGNPVAVFPATVGSLISDHLGGF